MRRFVMYTGGGSPKLSRNADRCRVPPDQWLATEPAAGLNAPPFFVVGGRRRRVVPEAHAPNSAEALNQFKLRAPYPGPRLLTRRPGASAPALFSSQVHR